MGYDPLEHEEVCILNDERPIREIEVCSENDRALSFKNECLVIEENRGK